MDRFTIKGKNVSTYSHAKRGQITTAALAAYGDQLHRPIVDNLMSADTTRQLQGLESLLRFEDRLEHMARAARVAQASEVTPGQLARVVRLLERLDAGMPAMTPAAREAALNAAEHFEARGDSFSRSEMEAFADSLQRLVGVEPSDLARLADRFGRTDDQQREARRRRRSHESSNNGFGRSFPGYVPHANVGDHSGIGPANPQFGNDSVGTPVAGSNAKKAKRKASGK